MMRKITQVTSGFAITALLFSAGAMLASADVVSSAVSGGALTVTTYGATLPGVTLDGTTQTLTGPASAAWTITDARGTGAAWTLSVSGGDLTSAAGSTETVARTIMHEHLRITPGTITASTDSDSATGITAPALVVTNSSQTLISAAGPHKGTYTLTPIFSMTMPANAFRSNWSGAVGSTTLLPYICTITYTIA